MAANVGDGPAPKDCDIRKGCTLEEAFAWSKAYYKANYSNDKPYQNAVYGKPSTGAGVYSRFKMDLAVPWKGPDAPADGKYKLAKTVDMDKYNADIQERIKPFMGKGVEEYNWLSNGWSHKSPFPAVGP
eukprot:gb/GFBE01037321.1/.p1 GENE.gb/GFBE01037321.1/~~gb/GFBE01037321.1/.p1  ORF type:complete len:129 (+),score=44.44 gb/GFBE01037321.1/:1-387(+)